MDIKSPHIQPDGEPRIGFSQPADYFGDLSAETLGTLLGASADIALVIEDGFIKDVALANEALISSGYKKDWVGKPWIETVTIESRPKIEALLKRAPDEKAWRQVNHVSQSALDVPVNYTTIPIKDGKQLVAFGHDLSEISLLQQKLISAHQDLERDYARMRTVEGRYRLLFNTSSEAILIVNGEDWTIEEANAAAETVTEHLQKDLLSSSITSLFEAAAAGRINTMVASASTQGAAAQADLALNNGKRVSLSGSAFIENDKKRIIIRITEDGTSGATKASNAALDRMVDHLPDGLVIADADQRIVLINDTFAQSAQLSSTQDAKGEPLSAYLGRSSTDINVLYSTLRKNGLVRNFATISRDRFGSEEKVEVSAVAAPTKSGVVYAFSVRGVSRRLTQAPRLDEKLPSAATDFTELVGRVPLKDIVNESTMLIERLCIEAALKISDNNRASAAEMLGLSRQGLYSKLKRVGLETGD
ncbi:MAG: transcriptional regulator PpsR [Pseudomonadota bacterium]